MRMSLRSVVTELLPFHEGALIDIMSCLDNGDRVPHIYVSSLGIVKK
jgi:hypothetical protein